MKSVSNPLTIIALFAALAAIVFAATCAASSMAEKITAVEAKNHIGKNATTRYLTDPEPIEAVSCPSPKPRNHHRKGFRLFWTRLSRRKIGGRPSANSQIRAMIKQMTQANPLWGALRIHGELLKLGIDISERSVSRLMPKVRKPPSAFGFDVAYTVSTHRQ